MQEEIRRHEERLRQAMLAGEFAGAPFAGRYRYLRTWVKRPGGWRVVGGSVCAETPGAGPR
jgi:hypothetical protein